MRLQGDGTGVGGVRDPWEKAVGYEVELRARIHEDSEVSGASRDGPRVDR